METTTKSSRMHSLVILYDMHTSFFPKALDGIKDEDTHKRLNTKANHIAWLTGSLVQQRFDMAAEFGIDRKQSADNLFCDNKGIQDDIIYPLLEEYKQDWNIISPLLRTAYVNAEEDKLCSPFEMPGFTMPYFDMVSFTIYREANIIGQLALWRRLLGYEGMKYM